MAIVSPLTDQQDLQSRPSPSSVRCHLLLAPSRFLCRSGRWATGRQCSRRCYGAKGVRRAYLLDRFSALTHSLCLCGDGPASPESPHCRTDALHTRHSHSLEASRPPHAQDTTCIRLNMTALFTWWLPSKLSEVQHLYAHTFAFEWMSSRRLRRSRHLTALRDHVVVVPGDDRGP